MASTKNMSNLNDALLDIDTSAVDTTGGDDDSFELFLLNLQKQEKETIAADDRIKKAKKILMDREFTERMEHIKKTSATEEEKASRLAKLREELNIKTIELARKMEENLYRTATKEMKRHMVEERKATIELEKEKARIRMGEIASDNSHSLHKIAEYKKYVDLVLTSSEEQLRLEKQHRDLTIGLLKEKRKDGIITRSTLEEQFRLMDESYESERKAREEKIAFLREQLAAARAMKAALIKQAEEEKSKPKPEEEKKPPKKDSDEKPEPKVEEKPPTKKKEEPDKDTPTDDNPPTSKKRGKKKKTQPDEDETPTPKKKPQKKSDDKKQDDDKESSSDKGRPRPQQDTNGDEQELDTPQDGTDRETPPPPPTGGDGDTVDKEPIEGVLTLTGSEVIAVSEIQSDVSIESGDIVTRLDQLIDSSVTRNAELAMQDGDSSADETIEGVMPPQIIVEVPPVEPPVVEIPNVELTDVELLLGEIRDTTGLILDNISNAPVTEHAEAPVTIVEAPVVDIPEVEPPVIELPVEDNQDIEIPTVDLSQIESLLEEIRNTTELILSYNSDSNDDISIDVAPPIVETPVVEVPTVEIPETDPPVIEPPVVEPPIVETPIVEVPTVEIPPTDPPVIEPPVVEVPAVEPPHVEVDEPELPAFGELIDLDGLSNDEVVRLLEEIRDTTGFILDSMLSYGDIEPPDVHVPDIEVPVVDVPTIEVPDLPPANVEVVPVEAPPTEPVVVETPTPDVEQETPPVSPIIESPDIEVPESDTSFEDTLLPLIEDIRSSVSSILANMSGATTEAPKEAETKDSKGLFGGLIEKLDGLKESIFDRGDTDAGRGEIPDKEQDKKEKPAKPADKEKPKKVSTAADKKGPPKWITAITKLKEGKSSKDDDDSKDKDKDTPEQPPQQGKDEGEKSDDKGKEPSGGLEGFELDELIATLEKQIGDEKKALKGEDKDRFKNQLLANTMKAGFKGLENGLGKLGDAFGKAMDNAVEQVGLYKSALDSRLQGTQSSYDDVAKTLKSTLAVSAIAKQTDVLKNLNDAVQKGIAYNVEQRAFLATMTDKVVSSFDALDANLTRIIRLQQADTTAARMGMEARLLQFFNSTFSDNSYLTEGYDTVAGALVDANAQMTRDMSIAFEFNVQKWMGSLSSLGFSNDTLSTIAQGINYLGSGNVAALAGNTQLQNLLAMSASRAGLSYSELLVKGIDDSSVNTLLKAMVEYLKEIANDQNAVVKAAYGDVFNFTQADLRAIKNLTEGDISNIANQSMTYSTAMSEIQAQMNAVSSRLSMNEKLDNVFDNFLYTAGESLASNPVTALMWRTLTVLEDVTGGIEIPFINVWGFGLDLNMSVEQLMKTAMFGLSALSNVGNMVTSVMSGGGADLGAWKFDEYTSRGGAFQSTVGGVQQSTSGSQALTSAASSDTKKDAIATTEEDQEEQKKKSEESMEDEIMLEDLYKEIFENKTPVFTHDTQLNEKVLLSTLATIQMSSKVDLIYSLISSMKYGNSLKVHVDNLPNLDDLKPKSEISLTGNTVESLATKIANIMLGGNDVYDEDILGFRQGTISDIVNILSYGVVGVKDSDAAYALHEINKNLL